MTEKLFNLPLKQGIIFVIYNKFSHITISADKVRSMFQCCGSNWNECNPQLICSFILHKYTNAQLRYNILYWM